MSSVEQAFEGIFQLGADFVAEFFFDLLAELFCGQFGADLAQAFLVHTAGFGAEFQRAAAAQGPFEADIAWVDLAGRVGHFALVAFDDDADAVVHAQHLEVDIAVTVDAHAGDAHFQIRVAGQAVAEGQVALELLERCVLAARLAAQGFTVEGGDALAQLLLKVGVEQHAVVDHETGVAVEGFDQRLLAVAAAGDGAGEIEENKPLAQGQLDDEDCDSCKI